MSVKNLFAAFTCIYLFINLLPGYSDVQEILMNVLKIVWLMGAFCIFLLNNFRGINPSSKILYLYAVKNLFNASLVASPLESVILTSRYLNLPIMIQYFNFIRIKNHARLLEKVLKYLSLFVILSGIPFMLNLIQSPGQAYNLTPFNDGVQISSGFIGIFNNFTTASISIAIATVYVFFLYKKEEVVLLRHLYLAVCLLGMYQVYIVYFRTGYVILLAGIYILFIDSKNRIRTIAKTIAIVAVFASVFMYLFQTDNVFRARILDSNHEVEERQIGSGRLDFARINLSAWYSDFTLVEKIFGKGQELNKENMKKEVGLRIFSHDGLIDSIVDNGLIGLALHLLFLGYYFRMIKKNKASSYQTLNYAHFFMLLFFTFIQGGVVIMLDIYTALYIALIEVKEKQEERTCTSKVYIYENRNNIAKLRRI